MTAKEFLIAFGTQLQQHDDLLLVESHDVFYWLNRAQRKLVESIFAEYQESEEMSSYLGPLTRDTLLVNAPAPQEEFTTGVTVERFADPDDYLYTVSVLAKKDNESFVVCKYRQSDKILALTKDPFNNPSKDRYIYTRGNDQTKIFFPNVDNIQYVRLTYIKKPNEILSDISTTGEASELPEFLHPKIVDMAVMLYSDSLRHKQNNERANMAQNT